MTNLVRRFEGYLAETLGLTVDANRWDGTSNLPYFLAELYTISQCNLLDVRVILLVAKNDEEQTPATIRKHVDQVRDKFGQEVVYLHPSISSYNRKRLIEYKVSFVVPYNQMYLPLLGIDIREHLRKLRMAPGKFSPVTQVVVLHALLHDKQEAFTPSVLAKELGYSAMSLTRAFDELETVELGSVAKEGRERVLRFYEAQKRLWDKALEHLRTPVKKRAVVQMLHNQRPEILAGLSALSQYSMLSPQKMPVYALSEIEWQSMKRDGDVAQLAFADPEKGSCEIEVWHYSPKLFAHNGVVDRLSLYLSLRGQKDERVESALDEMLEAVAW